LARTAGALFVRSYERGERVYVAMLARGYGLGDGSGKPARTGQRAPGRSWVRALTVPAAAAMVCAAALTVG
jgi:cobalt/nickel transport system permease protein